ncbi:MAG: hypothetical protein EOM69_07305, partial [Clostridia bacterium]|nr:hypothetical protein [Clostridia bacterium]
MKRVPAFVTLCIITLVAAILLGLTNTVTEGPIAQAALVAANEARIAVMPDADGFDELPLADGSQVDNVYKATKGGQLVGYTSTVTTQGFGGPVEVTLGLDLTGKLTAISVGGTNFQETAGLGAQAKEPGFTDQFKGVALPAALGDN